MISVVTWEELHGSLLESMANAQRTDVLVCLHGLQPLTEGGLPQLCLHRTLLYRAHASSPRVCTLVLFTQYNITEESIPVDCSEAVGTSTRVYTWVWIMTGQRYW